MTPGDIAETRRNCSGYLARRADHGPAKPARRSVRSHVTGWQDKATTDPAQLRRWWRKWPDAMPAIPAGSRSGIAVLDLDRKNGKNGFGTLRELTFHDLRGSAVTRLARAECTTAEIATITGHSLKV